MDRVFTMRFWIEPGATGASADDWRVRIRYVNVKREYHVDGVEKAFALVRSLLVDPGSGAHESRS